MKKADLKKMNRAELLDLQKLVAEVLKENEAEQKRQAQEELRRHAESLGFELGELVADRRLNLNKKAPPPAKFRSKDGSQEWSGRGRQPAWFKEYLESGGNADDLLIKENS